MGKKGESQIITPVQQIGIENNWTTVSAGFSHTVAIKANGTLWAWGRNEVGQLGDGTNTDRNIPVQIGNYNNWKSISANGGISGLINIGCRTLAIRNDGTLWVWGYNQNKELKSDINGNILIPIQIAGDSNWTSISTGSGHILLTKSDETDGTLWFWNQSRWGQVYGDIENRNPVQIGYSDNWAYISAGYGHSIAIRSNGTLWAWGWNRQGQLGDGTTTLRHIPVQIGNNRDWATVSAGGGHTVAIKTNGTLWAWGMNEYGQLGDGSRNNKFRPTQIGTDNNWALVSAGDYHTTAIKTDGTLWVWGRNNFNQLGIGVEPQNRHVLVIFPQ